jgi:hypothetical protein
MRAWPPFSFIESPSTGSGKENDLPAGRSFGARVWWRRALGQKYEGAVAAHVLISVACGERAGQTER